MTIQPRTLLRDVMLLLVLVAPSSVLAQLISCSMQGSAEEYKIYVDEVRVPGPADDQLKGHARYLRKALISDLKATLESHASVKICEDRFPNDSSDFDDRQVDSLNRLRVVLEVWADIESPTTAEGQFGFVLVPAKSIIRPVVFLVRNNFRGDVNGIMKKNKQLQAFAPIVLGTRFYKNEEYPQALPMLCQGQTQLQAAISSRVSQDDPQLVQREKELLARLDDVIDDAYRQARASGDPQFAALSPDENTHRFNCPK